MRFLKHVLIAIMLIWAIVYLATEIMIHRDFSKAALTDELSCSTFSTSGEKTHPDQIHYIVQQCHVGYPKGSGFNINTKIKVYEENKSEILHEEIIKDASVYGEVVRWVCRYDRPNSCELLLFRPERAWQP